MVIIDMDSANQIVVCWVPMNFKLAWGLSQEATVVKGEILTNSSLREELDMYGTVVPRFIYYLFILKSQKRMSHNLSNKSFSWLGSKSLSQYKDMAAHKGITPLIAIVYYYWLYRKLFICLYYKTVSNNSTM